MFRCFEAMDGDESLLPQCMGRGVPMRWEVWRDPRCDDRALCYPPHTPPACVLLPLSLSHALGPSLSLNLSLSFSHSTFRACARARANCACAPAVQRIRLCGESKGQPAAIEGSRRISMTATLVKRSGESLSYPPPNKRTSFLS